MTACRSPSQDAAGLACAHRRLHPRLSADLLRTDRPRLGGRRLRPHPGGRSSAPRPCRTACPSCPTWADARDQPLPAWLAPASRRQHAVPLGLRRQCRGRHGAPALPRSSSSSAARAASLAHALVDPESHAAADRRLGRGLRRRRRLPHPLSAGEDLGPLPERHSACGSRPFGPSASGSRSSSVAAFLGGDEAWAGSPISAASSPARS